MRVEVRVEAHGKLSSCIVRARQGRRRAYCREDNVEQVDVAVVCEKLLKRAEDKVLLTAG